MKFIETSILKKIFKWINLSGTAYIVGETLFITVGDEWMHKILLNQGKDYEKYNITTLDIHVFNYNTE